MSIRGVIFDLDGTVVETPYDWKKIKTELMTQGSPILSFIQSLDKSEKSEKWKLLESYERTATLQAVLKEGMDDLLDFLAKKGVKRALVTNNSRKNVSYLLKKFNLAFDCIISRESGLWKPSGAPFLAVLKKLKLKKEESCVVGDSSFDVKAAEEAGIERIFILNRDKEVVSEDRAEIFGSVKELKRKIKSLL